GKVGMERAAVEVTVRELDVERDLPAVEELERRCEVGLSGDQADGGKKKKKKSMSLCVEQIGDPLARVRHAPEHVMLVAECGVEMVGVVKACIKMVSRGRGIGSSSSSGSVAKQQQPATAYVKVAFILGLRVSPSHRYFCFPLFSFHTAMAAGTGTRAQCMRSLIADIFFRACLQVRFLFLPNPDW
uniref:Uncharacterized protein n=1 Tax=Aegilops tauschii subsp. strangulata TaxID=200361 RepID=A0A453T4S8_AEGTS